MMAKYFVDDLGRIHGEVIAEEPVNPLGYDIFEMEALPGNPFDYILVDGQPVLDPVPIPVPQSVTALQGLLAIDFFGMSEAFDAWAKSPDRTFAERAFIDKAQTWRRNDQTVLNAAGVLGLSEAQLDQMFIKAATFN